MPIRNMQPEDEQPLARPINEQQLARSASEEQAEVTRETEEERDEPRREEKGQTAPPADETSQGAKGPVARAMDKAQENNWVYGSVAEKARETGLVDKADGLLDKARNRLSGG